MAAIEQLDGAIVYGVWMHTRTQARLSFMAQLSPLKAWHVMRIGFAKRELRIPSAMLFSLLIFHYLGLRVTWYNKDLYCWVYLQVYTENGYVWSDYLTS